MIYDCAVIGGGVIGLSLAWQLALSGSRVIVVERQRLGREASWAGAGILPSGPRKDMQHPYDQLRAISSIRHAEWAEQLREDTGIDTGYRVCGGLYFARQPGESAALRGWRLQLDDEQIEYHEVSEDDLARSEPALSVGEIRYCLSLPTEAQLRNPRFLKALIAAGRRLHVEYRTDCDVRSVIRQGSQVTGIETSAGTIQAGSYCFTTGAWTYPLLQGLSIPINIVPIRGQMILFRTEQVLTGRIINEGSRYLVPREDGRLLAGSSEEEAGYDKSTTDEILQELRSFAESWLPGLREARIENTWAGLRPGSYDGFPYLDRLPDHDNAFVAAGHFRSGLYLSPATAENMAHWMLTGKPLISLAPFCLLRR
jgi:glycine oxidase